MLSSRRNCHPRSQFESSILTFNPLPVMRSARPPWRWLASVATPHSPRPSTNQSPAAQPHSMVARIAQRLATLLTGVPHCPTCRAARRGILSAAWSAVGSQIFAIKHSEPPNVSPDRLLPVHDQFFQAISERSRWTLVQEVILETMALT